MEWSGFSTISQVGNNEYNSDKKKINAHKKSLSRISEMIFFHCLNEPGINHQNHFNEEGVGRLFVKKVKTHLQI